VKEMILRHPEQRGELLVVFGHELGLGWWQIRILLAALMRNLQNVVNVLHRTKSLRVQVQDAGGLQLRESRLKVQLDSIGRPTFPATNLRMDKSN